MFKKYILPISLLAAVSLIFSGCGSAGESENGSSEGEGLVLEKDEFANFDNLLDLSEVYSEIDLIINNKKFNFAFMGGEKIDGVRTEHIQIDTEKKDMEIWIDENDKILKAVSDGKSLSVETAQPGILYVEYLYVFFKDQSWNTAWDIADSEDTSKDLGSGMLEITEYTFQIEGDPMTIINEVAKTPAGHLVVNYSAINPYTEETDDWRIVKLIRR